MEDKALGLTASPSLPATHSTAKSDPSDLVSWQSVLPADVLKKQIRSFLVSLIPGTLGVAILLAASVGLIFGVISFVNPGLLPSIFATLMIPLHRMLYVGPVFLIGLSWFGIYRMRAERCVISPRGLTACDRGRTGLHWDWKRCSGFRVSDRDDDSGSRKLIIYFKARRSLTYYLPSAQSAVIILALAQWIPLLEAEPDPFVPEPCTDWKSLLAYFVLTVAFSLGAACILAETTSKILVGVCLFGSLLIGPGTLSCLVLHPIRFWKFTEYRYYLFSLSFVFNLLGFKLMVIIFMVMTMHRI